MAYKQRSAQSVTEGGTGAVTLTDGGFLLGSGTGAITVTSQPTNGQTLVGNGGSDPSLATLTGDNGVTVTSGAGTITIGSQIVQIVSNLKISGSGTTSTSLVDVTGASDTITPTSSSNDILVMFNWNASSTNVASTNNNQFYAILRGATQLNTTDKIFHSGASGGGGDTHNDQLVYYYIDSPATTSATTYKLQQRSLSSSFTVTSAEINIILMEIV